MERIFWSPMRDVIEAQKHFSHLFNDRPRQETQTQVSWTPPVDIRETADGYDFSVELPGLSPEAVEVEVKDNTLTVKGERKDEVLKEGHRYLHRERPAGRFARVFRLSKPVNADGVTAAYKDGVLAVTVPFRAEAKPRKIVVQG
ncbi:MAG: Hsp20/alpha crystallin family protein [Deltaproteobacteria bacterium]|nr:Hsp20/alpha crystallin family protein [Deltaproteobacteria bacterium]